MISESLITQAALQVVTLAVTIGALRATLASHGRRQDKTEEKLDLLPTHYVPRPEVELALRAIREAVDRTYNITKSYFLGGHTIDAAADFPSDQPSEERLDLVHPDLAARVHAAMYELAVHGTFFRVAQGLRTYAEQDALFAQGRTTPGHIVTYARGGYSNHNSGCAVDCFPFLSGSSGAINWDPRSTQFQAMVLALRNQGLVWGGEWSKPDPPHFQLPGVAVTPTDADRAAFASGGLAAVWARIPGAEA